TSGVVQVHVPPQRPPSPLSRPGKSKRPVVTGSKKIGARKKRSVKDLISSDSTLSKELAKTRKSLIQINVREPVNLRKQDVTAAFEGIAQVSESDLKQKLHKLLKSGDQHIVQSSSTVSDQDQLRLL